MTLPMLAILALAIASTARLVLPPLRRHASSRLLPVATVAAVVWHGTRISLDTELVPFALLGLGLTVAALRERQAAPATPAGALRRGASVVVTVAAFAVLGIGASLAVALASHPVIRPAQALAPPAPVEQGVTVVAEHPYLRTPRDLAFNPLAEGELWVVNGRDHSVAILHHATTDAPTIEYRRDGKAAHFMHRPSAIAFGSPSTTIGIDGTFATAQESMDDAVPFLRREFMGPTLFSSSLDVFARPVAPTLLGSHLDMLHESPLAMGIAWERDHVYWVFGGYLGTISRYDFVEDHGVGHDDHANGVIRHHGRGVVRRVPGVPSHLAFDPATSLLYVADTGNARVLALDTRTGRPGAAGPGWEAGVDTRWVDGSVFAELVPAGTLALPSGLALADGRLYVGDHATGLVHVFGTDATPLGTVDSGAGEHALMGLTFGPDGRLYGVDARRGRILRLDDVSAPTAAVRREPAPTVPARHEHARHTGGTR